MTRLTRRRLLGHASRSALGLSMRSVITGLPVSFLLTGDAVAAPNPARIAILSSSGSGEPLNVYGPGTYAPELASVCEHPRPEEVDPAEVGSVVVNGVTLSVEDLSESAEVQLSGERVRMARCFEALSPEMRAHMVWFNYRTRANIHPQYRSVLTSYGDVHNALGRGAEEIPAAIAQEMAAILGTTTSAPFVLGGGSFSSGGSPLASYSPMKVKTLANSVGRSMGGPEQFGALYDHFIDQTYGKVKREGTAQQKRFLDQYASSKQQASAFGDQLGQMLEGIVDDTIESQLRTAVMIAKLRLSPVVVTNYSFGHDNHSDFDLSFEAGETLKMIKALDTYWKVANEMGVVDDTLYATVDVFGRTPKRGSKGGRGHYGSFTSGLIVGTHLEGGVIGGIDASGGKAVASGINSTTGSSESPDVAPEDTLNAYYRTLMGLVGVPPERREVRIPKGKEVLSML